MPIFSIDNQEMDSIEQSEFKLEKELQSLIEKNLGVVFNCRFVATEFTTGPVHSGRIDSLALSEDNNPVIIEYKKVESSDLINQSLFYLSWINDHRGDFEIAAQKSLGNDIEVDWSDVRVICIAPNYKKYDLHAVQVMGANIELWSYRLFNNSTLYLDEVFRRNTNKANSKSINVNKKQNVQIDYSVDERLEGKPEPIRELFYMAQEYIISLDSAIDEIPRKNYVAYKTSQNIVCIEVQKGRIFIYVKINPKTLPDLPTTGTDVSNTGHFGTGDLQLDVKTEADLEIAKPFIKMAYQKVGG